MAQHDVVVIGGSLGSTTALKQILAALPADLSAAVFVTTHMSSGGKGYLAEIMKDLCRLPVVLAVDGQPIQPGRVYFAVPDVHLLMIDHMVALGRGPRENMVRPSIDPLFRSAALSYGPRVIGVVLSGLLNDGAAGLHAIKARGGIAMVQHLLDAEAPSMPRAALEATEVDHVAPARALGRLIADLVPTEAGPDHPPLRELELEVDIAMGGRLGAERLREIAAPAALTCPHCQGVLSEIKRGGPLRFRCQIGHAITAEALASAQGQNVQEAIRIALRLMEERLELVTKMAWDARANRRGAVAELYEARAKEYEGYANTLRGAATLALRATPDTGADAI